MHEEQTQYYQFQINCLPCQQFPTYSCFNLCAASKTNATSNRQRSTEMKADPEKYVSSIVVKILYETSTILWHWFATRMFSFKLSTKQMF